MSSAFANAGEGFFTSALDMPEDHRPPLDLATRAQASVFQVSIGQGLLSGCSAQMVSPDGYLLTALHCIDDDAEQWARLGIEMQKSDGSTWVTVSDPAPSSVSLPRVQFDLAGIGHFVGPARVVLLGRGFGGAFPEWLDGAWTSGEATRESFRVNSEDFMILKVDLHDVKAPCVRVARSAPAAGQLVWAIGYPEPAVRANGHSAAGNTQFITYGEVHASYADNPALQHLHAPTEVIAAYDRMLLPPTRFMHSADAYIGMSGGMVMDAQGAMLGIIARGWSTDLAYSPVSTDSVAAFAVMDIARERLGAQRAAQVFSCVD